MPSPAQSTDERGSLKHLLEDDDTKASSDNQQDQDSSDATVSAEAEAEAEAVKSEDVAERMPRASSVKSTPAKATADQDPQSETATPQYTATTTTTRRNANGSVSSVYSGNKIRHLKKEDGVPLWRKDIQYDFLKYVFEDEQRVFHKASDGSSGNTFADIYLDAMAKSSKCSKILRDKLLSDRPAGVNMAMVCLLVNVGRMNTTLNFFPEMRAQLRTYHSIPSLQAGNDTNAYKQLQDAPRLKSILKGATEDVEQPGTIDDIKAAAVPRTNPVNLIFVLAQQAPKISEMHFDVPRDFFDLVMKEQLSSQSRATAFLWLMWWYLESNFTLQDALDNPYGPGRRSRDAPTEELPLKCPQFDFLTDEEAALENVDTPEELEFGEQKRQERLAIMNGDVTPLFSGPKRFNVQKSKMYPQNPVFSVNTNSLSNDDTASPSREVDSPGASASKSVFRSKPVRVAPKKEYLSDSDQTRSASPPATSRSKIRINNILNEDSSTPVAPPSRPGRGNWRRNRVDANGEPSGPRSSQGPLTTVFVPHNGAETSSANKRSRPPTSHQIALENFRKQRVDHILDRGLRLERKKAHRKRRHEGPIERAWKRLRSLESGWDSEEEAHTKAAGRITAAQLGIALAGYKQNDWEVADYGAETAVIAQAFRRLHRRLERHEMGDEAIAIAKAQRRAGRRETIELGDEMELDENDDMDDGTVLMTTQVDDDQWSEED